MVFNSRKFIALFWMIEKWNDQDSWHGKQNNAFNRTRASYFTWTFAYEKTVCAMSATFSNIGRRLVPVDEKWIHYYTPASNRQSAEWLQVSESLPKRPKTQRSAGKVMVSIFWDAHGIRFIDYLVKGKTITCEY